MLPASATLRTMTLRNLISFLSRPMTQRKSCLRGLGDLEAAFPLNGFRPFRERLIKGLPISARILVVENHPASQKLMAYLLENDGHHVRLASTGEEALELVQHEEFDLILCDIRMSGVDGYEVARRLKTNPKHSRIPLVAVTALVQTGDREQLLSAGFDGYVPKASSPQRFIELIQSFLSASRLKPPAMESPQCGDGAE
jgi:two-component system cell cycle response regulator DivK